ncbi:hypothetical protein TcCL_ESM09632 [Trypanosoma cruzi]|nr:hypothetical protein TcCL_ESM09632 [Trypanosoma cruzi]
MDLLNTVKPTFDGMGEQGETRPPLQTHSNRTRANSNSKQQQQTAAAQTHPMRLMESAERQKYTDMAMQQKKNKKNRELHPKTPVLIDPPTIMPPQKKSYACHAYAYFWGACRVMNVRNKTEHTAGQQKRAKTQNLTKA